MAGIETEQFPLSTTRQTKGNRRLAREKALQVLISQENSGMSWGDLFSHIFFRMFNLGDEEEQPTTKKLLTQDEIADIEADTPIRWKNDEIDFGRSLIEHAIDDREDIDSLIKKYAKNWDFHRIALIDRLIMRLTTVEFIYYPEIPTKVSINEALDIAKKYSTDKSSPFINGMLDSILLDLKEKGRVKKTGRGLKNK